MKIFLAGFFLLIAGISYAQVSLRGVVTNIYGEPLPFATVSLEDGTAGTACDFDGRFELTLQPGTYHILVRYVGHEPLHREVTITEDTYVEFQLVDHAVSTPPALVCEEEDHLTDGLMIPMEVRNIERIITRSPAQSIGGALSILPGVSSLGTGINAAQPVIRGLYGSRIGFIVDGIPQQNQQWGDDHGLAFDPWQAERLAVVRGSSSLIYGPNASAGAILARPGNMLQRDSQKVSAFSRYQTVNNSFDLGANAALRWNRLELEAMIIGRSYADLSVPDTSFTYLDRVLPLNDGRLVNTSGESLGYRARLRYVGKKTGYRLSFRGNHDRYGIFPGIFGIPSVSALEGDGEPRTTQLPSMVSDYRMLSGHIHHKFDPLNELVVSAAWQRSGRSELGEGHAHGFGPAPEDSLALSLQLDVLYGSVRLLHSVARYDWSVGLQTEHQNGRSGGWEFLVPSHRSSMLGGFVTFSRVNLFGGELSGGIRYDIQKMDVESYEEAVYSPEGEVVGTQVRSPGADPLQGVLPASLLWQHRREKHTFDLQLARSGRFPTAYELAANGVHHATFRHEIGDPELDPELGYQFDGQYRYFFEDFVMTVSPFVAWYENFIYLAPSGSFSDLPEAGQSYQFRQNEVFRTGGELDVAKRLSHRIYINANLEYVYAWNLDLGTGLPWTPPLRSELMVMYQWPFKMHDLEIRASGSFVAPQELTARNETATEGYAIMNLEFVANSKKYSRRFNWSIFANNIFNTAYIDHMSRYKLIGLPEPARNFGVQLTFTIDNQ